jgi:hypothetical protein
MAETAEYRFLPWTRRGLAAEVGGADSPTAALPERAAVAVGLTVTGVTPSAVNLALYGPGDVLGIDPRLIVRTDPRPSATDVEPNYLPAIEFDPPDLPWMFTPAAADANQRLRPWVVLICVDRAVVDPPHVTTSGGARGPLPVVELTAAAVASELPDLAESWGWAHTQVASDDSAGPVTPPGLAAAPTLNVSRLLCPRRLHPGRQYIACVVPAFDAGVRRGLTGAQPSPPGTTAPPLGPAWDVTAPTDLVLPVYFHWEFTTGPAGDFEELARKLQPFACPPTVGFSPMHVGHARPDLPEISPGQTGATLDMDGALRAPVRDPGTLGEVVATLRQGLRRALNAAADNADGSATDETPVLGPPLYGEWHTRRHRLPAGGDGWFNEANLDPRSRVASGLATEVVRRNQEELMHAAWEQVGRVQEANALLTWGRLAIEVGRRWHERHLEPLPGHRLAQLTAPLAARVLLGERTVRASGLATSLPDAAGDPALRRLTGGRHRLVRHAAAPAAPARSETVPSELYASLAAGRVSVDPNVFDRDGLVSIVGLADVEIPGAGAPTVDLTRAGLPLAVPADLLRDGRTRFRTVTTSLSGVGEGMTAKRVTVRPDLRVTGMLTKDHFRSLARTPSIGGTVLDVGGLPGLVEDLRRAAAENPGAVAFHVDASIARPRVNALDVDGRGNIVVRTPLATAPIRVGRLAESAGPAAAADVGEMLGRLVPGALPSARRIPVEPPIVGGPGGPVINPPGGPIVQPPEGPIVQPPRPVPPTQTVPPLIRDVSVIGRYENAWADVRTSISAVPPVPERRFVQFAVAAAATAVLAATDPVTVIPRRLTTMLTVAGRSLLDAVDPKLELAVAIDRVLAYPELPIPTYELLARYDPDRFVPGIGIVPPNAITLLETNPRFVEAFLLGLNHEFNRELLWREYPTDRRGTPLRHFWSWADGLPDIPPIHEWPASTALGRNTRGGGEGQLVLLVRGDLLRRYPNTVVVAWRADGDELKEPPASGDIVHHVFDGWFAPDVTFFGFPLTEDDLAEGWFFVLMEQPTEPRFGFDEGAAEGLTRWLHATWAHTATDPGEHLALADNPLSGRSIGGVTFGRNAGHLAAVALQRPVRVAINSTDIVASA